MTTGELAKKAGVSQKTIRLYDEKGLLKPSAYSEGNYRLYEPDALLTLEKIIALKQVGFSLDEIKENLLHSKDEAILETLQHQIDLMEAKCYELEKAIARIKAAIVRSDNNPDWDTVTDIIRELQSDQNSDEAHLHALTHSADTLDWYVKIYNSLNISEGERILDLGCGFAKLWRNNWTDIPSGVTIDAYDLHASWADDFAQFIPEHSDYLATNTRLSLFFEDVEKPETWHNLAQREPYSLIIAHYLISSLHEPESFLSHVRDVLDKDGMFSVNHTHTSDEDVFWIDTLHAAGLNPSFADDAYREARNAEDNFKEVLKKYFREVTEVVIPSPFRYLTSDDLFDRALNRFPQAQEYLLSNKQKLITYFDILLEAEGEVIINNNGVFRHCYK